MAVHIRLTRGGAKKSPYYRVVVADQRAARGGRFIENIGTYDPNKDPGALLVDQARLDYWRSVGATPSHTVDRLLKKLPAAGAPAAAAKS